MKWGRKTSSPPSFGSRVFPGSWFSKLKQIGDGEGSTLDTTKQPRGKLDSRQARFYSLDDDPFWTLSFRKDRGEGRARNHTIITPLSNDSDAELKQGPCRNNRGAQPSRAKRRGFGTLVPQESQEGRRSHRSKGRRKLNKETQISDSFAVVKTSFNPQQDFRDSMLEMIREKGIRRRQDLQQLLACYLTLNSDTHHHLIINVFQHLCFESIHSQSNFE